MSVMILKKIQALSIGVAFLTAASSRNFGEHPTEMASRDPFMRRESLKRGRIGSKPRVFRPCPCLLIRLIAV